MTILQDTGILNGLLGKIGLGPLHIIGTETAVVIGMVYDYLPFMILPLYNALMKIKDDTLNGARDLGASEILVFTRIIFPLSLPGMISGITMVFIPSLTTVAISEMLGGGHFLLIGNVIEQEFIKTTNQHLGSGLSIALIIFVLLVMGITNQFTDKDNEIAVV